MAIKRENSKSKCEKVMEGSAIPGEAAGTQQAQGGRLEIDSCTLRKKNWTWI